jgi:hypothetical protein
MDAEPPPSRPSISPLKAAAVLIVFVVATVVLVAYGTRAVTAPTGTPSSAATTSTTTLPTTTTTTTAGHSTTSTTTAHHGHGSGTTTTTVAHSTVSVVVANATTVNGVAAHYSTVIGAGGWNMKPPADADTSETTSSVYYAPGRQASAASIAASIGVKPAQVVPISSATPLSPTTGYDVVVIIGQDLATAPGA